MRIAVLFLAFVLLAAPPVRAQQPPLADIARGLFGEREPEPGDEEEAAGQIDPGVPQPSGAGSSAAYDARVRDSFAAAQALQGSLDGGWTLSSPGGEPLYAIRIADRAGVLEAAWRDLRGPGGTEASGVVEQAERRGSRLTLRFSPSEGRTVTITLASGAGGVWRGELAVDGRTQPVSFARTSS